MLDQLNELVIISINVWAYSEEPFPYG